MNTRAAEVMIAARTALVLQDPFFGALVLRLPMSEDTTARTMWTDGTRIGYSPAYVLSITHAERVAVLSHEVSHCVSGHPWRRDGRDPKQWNVACDYAINPILRDAGYTLPGNALLVADYSGRSAEWIHARLPSPAPAPQAGEPGEDSDAGEDTHAGEVRDAPPDTDPAENGEQEWQRATQQAARMAAAMGKLPGTLARYAQDAVRPVVDWRAVLRRFCQEVAKADYTFARPNRRYAAHGLYLPSLHTEGMGPLVVVVDTSGSIDDVMLAQAASEIGAISEDVAPASVTVIYADSEVAHVDTFARGEPIDIRPHGGGGTDFRPAFDWIAANMPEGPACMVYLTDLAGVFPEEPPDYPVLWAVARVPGYGTLAAPWGETVEVTA